MAQKTIQRLNNKDKRVSVKSKSRLKLSKSLIIPESNLKKRKSNAIIQGKFISREVPKKDLCSHCGIREKGPGFRFLCRYCFRNAGDESIYSINSSTLRKDIFFTKIPK